MIFFTADTHFNHEKILEYCNRSFANIHEHNEHLIDQWNSRVNKKDTIYHLGDFGFSPSKFNVEALNKIANNLHGNIILIRGNHDTNISSVPRFKVIKDYHVIRHNKIKIVMLHYAMRTWEGINQGGIHLFGHSHSNLPTHYKSFDCGVDYVNKIWGNYRPITVDEVFEYAATLKAPEKPI